MSYKAECRSKVRNMVWEALECCKHDRFYLAMIMDVDESTIRNWRDGRSIPLADHYLMLCRFVESEGGDDLLSDDKMLQGLCFSKSFFVCGKSFLELGFAIFYNSFTLNQAKKQVWENFPRHIGGFVIYLMLQ